MESYKMISKVHMELLLSPSLMPVEQIYPFALQLLAWTHLSDQGERLDPQWRVASVLEGTNADLLEAPKHLETLSGAFRGMAAVAAIAGANTLRSSLQECEKLRMSGHLQSFRPIDAAYFHPMRDVSAISPDLADLMVKVLGVDDQQSVYCGWDASGQFVGRLMPIAKQVFSESASLSPLPSLMPIFMGGVFEESVSSDPLLDPKASEAGQLRKFDVGIALALPPPMGAKLDPTIPEKDLYGRFHIPKASRTVLAIQHLLAQATTRVVVAVPNSVLFQNSGADREFRTELIKKGVVQAVIALPSGLLQASSVPLALMVLSPAGGHQAIRFINADDDHFRTRYSKTRVELKQIDELAALVFAPIGDRNRLMAVDVPNSQALDNEVQLQVSRYVLPASQRNLASALTGRRMCALRDFFETVRPLPTKTNETSELVDVWEIGTQDLPTRGSITRPGRRIQVAKAVAEKSKDQFLQPGDIVMMIKGTVGKVGIVPASVPPPGEDGWIAGQSATVLRVGKQAQVDAWAMFAMLRSPLGQQLLGSVTSGATIQLISLRELMQLEVPLPSPEESASAVDILAREDELQRQIDELAAQQSKLARDLWSLDPV